MEVLQALAAVGALGGCFYYLLVLAAACGFLARRKRNCPPATKALAFSVLKPLAGDEAGLQENLRGFFQLDYPDYELLFAARDAGDPALRLAASLVREHPKTRAATLAVGESPCPNAKVHSLAAMTLASSGEVLVVSDSDIRTDPGLLRSLAAEFEDPDVGVVTCPYRAVPGPSVWSVLESLEMNGDMWPGVLAAQWLAPMDFAVGPTMAIRRSCLQAVGGWQAVEEHLAEDFELGRLARRAGYKARLGTHVVEHRIGAQGFAANLAHRIRWRRSTRRSRPVGYWGQVFTFPLPWAGLAAALPTGAPWPWMLLACCAGLRIAVMQAVGRFALQDEQAFRYWWLVPIQDVLSGVLWLAGFFGDRIVWRNRPFRLLRDGRLQRVEP